MPTGRPSPPPSLRSLGTLSWAPSVSGVDRHCPRARLASAFRPRQGGRPSGSRPWTPGAALGLKAGMPVVSSLPLGPGPAHRDGPAKSPLCCSTGCSRGTPLGPGGGTACPPRLPGGRKSVESWGPKTDICPQTCLGGAALGVPNSAVGASQTTCGSSAHWRKRRWSGSGSPSRRSSWAQAGRGGKAAPYPAPPGGPASPPPPPAGLTSETPESSTVRKRDWR